MTQSLDAAETGVEARILASAEAASVLGTDSTGRTRFYWGWPAHQLAKPSAADFPRSTYYRVPGGQMQRPGTGIVRLRIDEWAWPSGAEGGKAKLAEIDSMLLELLDEQHWTYGGGRLYAVALPSTDFPAGPGTPIRRMRPFDIYVSPAL